MTSLQSGAVGAIVLAVLASMAPARADVIDRADALVGTWNCQTSAGSSATLTFTRQDDGSISMRNVFTGFNAGSGEFDETYRLMTPAQYWMWTATSPNHPDVKEAGTAGMWTATSWFFDGTVTRLPHSHDTDTHRIRMIYTWISNAAFEREFELYDGSVWKTTSSSVCRKVSS
jgi:hypothetical protein